MARPFRCVVLDVVDDVYLSGLIVRLIVHPFTKSPPGGTQFAVVVHACTQHAIKTHSSIKATTPAIKATTPTKKLARRMRSQREGIIMRPVSPKLAITTSQLSHTARS